MCEPVAAATAACRAGEPAGARFAPAGMFGDAAGGALDVESVWRRDQGARCEEVGAPLCPAGRGTTGPILPARAPHPPRGRWGALLRPFPGWAPPSGSLVFFGGGLQIP